MNIRNFLTALIGSIMIIPVQGQMVVNEIMFKPGPNIGGCDQKLVSEPAPTCGREYIELFNSDCANDFDLSGFVLASASSTSPGLQNGGAICFPPGTVVPAGSFLIIGGANDHNPTANGTYDYPANSFDFKIPNYIGTQYLCLNTANTYWFLANVDGWMGLFEPDGSIHKAVYWCSSASNISSVADFDLAPCSPSAYTGPSLPSAKTIYTNAPSQIEYLGNPMNITQGLTFSRMPDGGAYQPNRPPTIGPLRSDRCNDGQCIACGNLVVDPTPDTCSLTNGTITAEVVNQATSPPPYTYTLTGPVNIGPITTSTNPYIFTNLPAGTYAITIVDNFSPPNTTTDTVVVGTTGSLSLNTSSTTASCNANDGTATVNASGGAGNYIYQWSTNPVQTTATATNLSQGQYTVTVSSSGCSSTTSVTVNGESGPTVTTSSSPEYCGMTDGSASVTAAGGSGSYTYAWSNGQTTSSISDLPAGTYTVTVSDGSSCSPTASIIISNNPGPDAQLTADPSYAPPGSSINLSSGNNNNINTWEWSFGDNNSTITTTPNTSYIYSSPGSYTVWLIVTDNNGCSDSASLEINILEFEVPNVITPNGDGYNETFLINGLESVSGKNLQIFNRWGSLIYEDTNYADDWNANGCSDGVYYFVLKVPVLGKEITGTITVLN